MKDIWWVRRKQGSVIIKYCAPISLRNKFDLY